MKLKKILKPALSLFMAVALLFGVLYFPAHAVGTTTAARIYADFSDAKAFKSYEDFAALYVPDCAIPIPGLAHTDVNGIDCTTMVPQGICLAEEYLIISAFDSEAKCHSVLYVLCDGSFLTALVLPTKGMVSGLAFDGTYLWVTNGKNVSGIPFSVLDSTVDSAVAAGKSSIGIKFYSNCAIGMQATFLTYHDNMLWAGEYKNKGDTSGKLYGYSISADARKLVKCYSISLPDRVRGVCFQDDCLIISRSNSRNISSSDYISQLRVYKLSEPANDGTILKTATATTIDLPPMVAGICSVGEYLYAVYASGATPYFRGTDGNGKCKYPVDRIIPFRFADFIESDMPAVPEDAFALSANTASVMLGSSLELTALFSEGSVTWKSSNPDVLSITPVDACSVTVQALAPGKATVICTLNNGSIAKCAVTVDGEYFQPCSEHETSLANALVAQSYDSSLDTRILIARSNSLVDYTGSSEEDAQLLELMKAGKLINPGLTHDDVKLSVVTLTDTKLDMSYGQKTLLRASFPEGAVAWKSSNTKVLTVNAVDTDTAELHAIGEGKATITCTLSNGSIAKCVIYVTYLYFEKCSSTQQSIVRALQELTIDPSFENRTLIAEANGILNYKGSAEQNESMLELMLAGKLINPGLKSYISSDTPANPDDYTGAFFPQCASAYESISLALESFGYDGSFAFRAEIAAANGIADYSGTAEQNVMLLDLMKAGKLLKPDFVLAFNERLVCFNANGGEGDMEEIVFVNGSALPFNLFTKKGYQFAGWATSAEGAVLYADGAAVTLPESTTLYAVWKPIQYILRYNADGGTGTMEDTIVTYGVDSTLRTPAFTREGYTLSGWYRYRTSDNKWLYKSEDGKTNSWYLEGEQPAGYAKNVMKTTSSVSKTSSLDGDVVILYAVWKKGSSNSLDGKKVMFIGNSFIYYGGVVELGNQRKTDKGWFYDICKANGESVSVYDCTYGNHRLSDFTSKGCKGGSCHNGKDLLSGINLKTIDYVFISEAGNNNANFVRDIKNIVKRFPSKTKFVYLSHSYSYIKNHTNITKKLGELQKLDIMVVEWGKLVDDVIDGRTKVSGATVKYSKNTFIKNKGDTHHPNPLAGYITAQMAYCAVTGKTAVGQMPDLYTNGNSVKYGQSVVGYSAFISKHYKSSTSSNFKTVMKSKADIKGLQKLMNKYLASRGLGIDAKK